MNCKYKIKLTLSIGFESTQTEELDLAAETGKTEEELEALPSSELEELVYSVWKEWAWGYIDGGGELLVRKD